MGGEQRSGTPALQPRSGSSPHGRGTVAFAIFCLSSKRFIPAWAGNRIELASDQVSPPVHPRMGGEQRRGYLAGFDYYGSSPHGRGTDDPPVRAVVPPRFIPAWAGNSSGRFVMAFWRPVHPRMGGEQYPSKSAATGITGSSPHGRGTDVPRFVVPADPRFIPAWAGNSWGYFPNDRVFSVHPRMGGEQNHLPRHGLDDTGSSPHGRGTVSRVCLHTQDHRFIPAWAGNSSPPPCSSPPSPVHPRMGGEQTGAFHADIATPGSSPHGRGTDGVRQKGDGTDRFIPAWAGNRRPDLYRPAAPPVHPRMGGEQSSVSCSSTSDGGSSPHGRGTGDSS